jgi:hypothetical protein
MLDADKIVKNNTKYFESKLAQKYDSSFEEFSRLNNLIINKKGKLQKEDYDITDSSNSVSARFKSSRVSFNKPKYASFFVLKEKVNEDILFMKHKYDSLKKQILYDSSSDQKEIIEQFKSMTEKMNNLYKLRNVLQTVHLLHKTNKEEELQKVTNEIHDAKTKRLVSFSEINNVKTNEQDSIRATILIQEYIKDKTISAIIDLSLDKRNLEDFHNLIHEIVLTLPSVDGSSDGVSNHDSKTSSEKIDPKMSKIDKKAKKILQMNQTQEFNASTYKKKLTKFLFNTIDECKNSKRSKEYYMSKDQILEVISKDPDLQRKLGKMYKTLSKEELCKKLSNTSEIPNAPQTVVNNDKIDGQQQAPENVKDSSEFPFKTTDECTSSKRSKLHYMSREDIMKQIDNNHNLKTKVGDGYRKLSKDELCNKLMV